MVMHKVLDDVNTSFQVDDVAAPFGNLLDRAPQIRKSINDYHPQIMTQFTDNIKSSFKAICEKHDLNEKLSQLEELMALALADNRKSANDTDKEPVRISTNQDEEVALPTDMIRRQIFELKRIELENLENEIDAASKYIAESTENVREEEGNIKRSKESLCSMQQRVSRLDEQVRTS